MWPFRSKAKQESIANPYIHDLESSIQELAETLNSNPKKRRRRIPVEYYTDAQAIRGLAANKGIDLSDVTIEVGRTVSDALTQSAGLNLKTPLLGASIEEQNARGEAIEKRVRMAASPNLGQLLDATVSALRRDGEIRTDLLDIPNIVEEEAQLLKALSGLPERWEIQIVEPDGDSYPDADTEDPLVETLANPIIAIRSLAHMAIRQARIDLFSSLDPGGELCMIEADWEVAIEGPKIRLIPMSDLPSGPPDPRAGCWPIFITSA